MFFSPGFRTKSFPRWACGRTPCFDAVCADKDANGTIIRPVNGIYETPVDRLQSKPKCFIITASNIDDYNPNQCDCTVYNKQYTTDCYGNFSMCGNELISRCLNFVDGRFYFALLNASPKPRILAVLELRYSEGVFGSYGTIITYVRDVGEYNGDYVLYGGYVYPGRSDGRFGVEGLGELVCPKLDRGDFDCDTVDITFEYADSQAYDYSIEESYDGTYARYYEVSRGILSGTAGLLSRCDLTGAYFRVQSSENIEVSDTPTCLDGGSIEITHFQSGYTSTINPFCTDNYGYGESRYWGYYALSSYLPKVATLTLNGIYGLDDELDDSEVTNNSCKRCGDINGTFVLSNYSPGRDTSTNDESINDFISNLGLLWSTYNPVISYTEGRLCWIYEFEEPLCSCGMDIRYLVLVADASDLLYNNAGQIIFYLGVIGDDTYATYKGIVNGPVACNGLSFSMPIFTFDSSSTNRCVFSGTQADIVFGTVESLDGDCYKDTECWHCEDGLGPEDIQVTIPADWIRQSPTFFGLPLCTGTESEPPVGTFVLTKSTSTVEPTDVRSSLYCEWTYSSGSVHVSLTISRGIAGDGEFSVIVTYSYSPTFGSANSALVLWRKDYSTGDYWFNCELNDSIPLQNGCGNSSIPGSCSRCWKYGSSSVTVQSL